MQLKIKARNRTYEENIEFLKSIRKFYKLGPKCDKYSINKSNLYNLLNNKTLTVRPELVNELVEDVIKDLVNSIQNFVEIVEDDHE